MMFRVVVKALLMITLCGGCSVVSSHQAQHLTEDLQSALLEYYRLGVTANSHFEDTSGSEAALTARDRLWIRDREKWMEPNPWKNQNVYGAIPGRVFLRERTDERRHERLNKLVGCFEKGGQKKELNRCLNR
jgi:hypothetical protein